jgi:hypothetical protein
MNAFKTKLVALFIALSHLGSLLEQDSSKLEGDYERINRSHGETDKRPQTPCQNDACQEAWMF